MIRLFSMLVAIFFALVAYEPANAQPCLFLKHADNSIEYGQKWVNPDSVLVDTCCAHTEEFKCLYANKFYFLQLEPGVYPFADLLTKNDVRRPQDMLASVQEFKDSLLALESILGAIYIQGTRENADSANSYGNPLFKLFLENYQSIDEVIYYFSNFPFVKNFYYDSKYGPLLSVDEKYKINKLISPNPSHNIICLEHLQRGENFNIYNTYGSIVLLGSISADKTINVEWLSPGVYVIITKGGTERFVKE